jgi:Arc/MetJ family transcription regulator
MANKNYCTFIIMRVNIEINDDLMAKAQQLSGMKSKNAMVEAALRLYVAIESQKKLSKLCGKIEIDDKAYDLS